MIVDIPTPAEFRATGMHLLNSAWGDGAGLLKDMDFHPDGSEMELSAYWTAARMRLSTALSLAHQGSEFLLKARIAEVSPYLLLGPASQWPGGCSRTPKSFSEFRTVDAQDLVRIHNTVRSLAVSEAFVTRYETLRKKRNVISHSVDRKLHIHAEELLTEVLYINEELGDGTSWSRVRHAHLQTAPLSQMSAEWGDHQQVWEFSIVPSLLSGSELMRFFGVPKQRRYICPNCANVLARHSGLLPITSVLRPNTSESPRIWCFVCDETQEVVRIDCPGADCKGNVISVDWTECLSCRRQVDLPEA